MDPSSNFCTKCGSNINGEINNQVTNTNKKNVSIGSCIGISIATTIILFIIILY